MRFFRNFINHKKNKKKLARIKKEPLLEFSYQVFQNDIPRIEIIRQKSLEYIPDLEIVKNSDLAIKILTFEDEKLINRVRESKYKDFCFQLIHPPETPICYSFYAENRMDLVDELAKNVLIRIFDYKSSDEIEVGIILFD